MESGEGGAVLDHFKRWFVHLALQERGGLMDRASPARPPPLASALPCLSARILRCYMPFSPRFSLSHDHRSRRQHHGFVDTARC